MAEAIGVLRLLLATIAIGAGAMAVYLLALSVAAIVRRPATPMLGPRTRWFAVLVPAHDEALIIARLLTSLTEQDYPRDRFDVLVVADNCVDSTADVARAAGAIVHERLDPERRTKGHALRWLLERARGIQHYDAYVVFDADSVVAPDFLARMDARLEAGSRVIQGHYRVLNRYASPISGLREAAFASLHYLRPLGRAALGLSCGLKGNGMCFEAEILDRFGWPAFGLAEDVELHLELVRAGVRVDFAPEAVVWADMPVTLNDARSQNLRWEAGRLTALKRQALPLLRDGLARGDLMAVDAAAEELVPPLSVAVAASAACALAAAIAGSTGIAAVAFLAGAGLVGHIVMGLVVLGAPARSYLSLLHAPRYVVWKVSLYAAGIRAPSGLPWIRTERRR